MDDIVIDNVHKLCKMFRPNIIPLLIEGLLQMSSLCGLGFFGPRKDLMFSVTSWSCATGKGAYKSLVPSVSTDFSARSLIQPLFFPSILKATSLLDMRLGTTWCVNQLPLFVTK